MCGPVRAALSSAEELSAPEGFAVHPSAMICCGAPGFTRHFRHYRPSRMFSSGVTTSLHQDFEEEKKAIAMSLPVRLNPPTSVSPLDNYRVF